MTAEDLAGFPDPRPLFEDEAYCTELVVCEVCGDSLGVADARVWRLGHVEDGSHEAIPVDVPGLNAPPWPV